MRAPSPRLAWLPPLLLGTAAATACEVSMGLLLYSGPGFMRSLTTVLVVQSAALGVGLWSAPGPEREDLLEAVRRRWLLGLGAFIVAAFYSGFWSVLEPAGGAAAGQGLGLALMGAFPLYACGTVLGGVASVATRHADAGISRVGAWGFAGALLGFAMTGFALPRALAPASLFLGCVILLSAGGLIWGGGLDGVVRTKVKARRLSAWGMVRVEDRLVPDADEGLRVLWEGDTIRRWLGAEAHAVVPWDVALFRRWAESRSDPGRVLLVGGGASALPGAAVREFPAVTLDVLERNAAVAELASEHLNGGQPTEGGRVRIVTGPLEDGLDELGGGYDLVLVDASALGPRGGAGRASRHFRTALEKAVGASGALAVGPRDAVGLMPTGWPIRPLKRTLEVNFSALGLPIPPQEEVLVSAPAEGLPWLEDEDTLA